MKLFLPVIAAAFSISASATAVTLDDLAPSALIGKKLTFTVEGGSAPLATVGTWSCVFDSGTVALTNSAASGANLTGSWSYIGAPFSDSHGYAISPILAGNKAGDITLWISVSGIRFLIDADGGTQFGGVELADAAAPEIEVRQPASQSLADGKGTKNLGRVAVGRTSPTTTFTIRNTGNAALKNLALKIDGAQKKDFLVSGPGKRSLAAGQTTTFQVNFRPNARGTRNAAIHITSNDADESPFDIKLKGTGR